MVRALAIFPTAEAGAREDLKVVEGHAILGPLCGKERTSPPVVVREASPESFQQSPAETDDGCSSDFVYFDAGGLRRPQILRFVNGCMS